MLVKHPWQCPQFQAGDATLLRELLHPRNDAVPLPFSIAHARLAPGTRSLPHALSSDEVYYILRGDGRMHVGSAQRKVAAGDTVHIPPRARQWIENVGAGDLEFLAVVGPPWRAEDEAVE
ncbi:MAG: cupin domain-containing protein [Gammaproteobacteria bacterium]